MSIKLVNKKLTEELRRSGASVTKKNDQAWKNFLNPKATAEGKYYRLRLLWFSDETSKRTTPFVEKYCHTIYNRDEAGKLDIDFVTCPTSPYLKVKNAWKTCPICQFADKQYQLAKGTDWNNQTAATAHRKFRRDFVAFIPVFVIQDPNIPENTGRIMLLKIRERDEYIKLCDVVKANEYEHNVFNGQMALDLAVQAFDVPNTDKEGNPRINKHTGEPYTHREYKFMFSKKPYDVEIPIDQLESLDFDSSMYTFSDEHELTSFLGKYTLGVDVPEDDIDLGLDAPVVHAPAESTESAPLDDILTGDNSKTDAVSIDFEDGDLNLGDLDGTTTEPDNKSKDDLVSDEVNLDDILGDLGDIEDLDI